MRHMSLYTRLLSVAGLFVVCFASVASTAWAEDATGANYLPPTTVVYAEVTSPAELLAKVLNHPFVKNLQATDEYKKLTEENPDYLKARAGVGIFEFVVGRDWDQAIEDIGGEGVYLGVDSATKGAVLLTHAPKEKTLGEIRDRLIKAAKDDAARKGKELDIEEHEYRGHTVYKTKDAVAGVFGSWLVITNKPELGRTVADRLLDGKGESLAALEEFNSAQKKITGEPVAWAYVNIAAARDAGFAKELYREKSDNPGVELLVGGILSTLKRAPAGTAAVYLEEDSLRLAMNLPHDRLNIPAERAFYFGEQGEGAALTPLQPKNSLLSVTSYRDVGEMWRRRSDLFNEKVNADLAQADSNLSTVFAGLDFGREVLGVLEPHVQILSAEQSFEGRDVRTPKIQLPSMAMVFQLKEPEKMQRQLKVSFQSLIGLTNLGAGQNDLPQLEMQTEDVHGGKLVSATYENLPEDVEVANDIIYNFSPSLAFVEDHFIVASTRELALELMELSQAEAEPLRNGGRIVNTRATLGSETLRKSLDTNRDALIAQNMLENGHTRQEAQREIDTLFSLLRLAGDISVEIVTSYETLRLETTLGLTATSE